MFLNKVFLLTILIPFQFLCLDPRSTIHVLSEHATAQFSGPSEHHYHPAAGNEGIRGTLIGGLKFGVMEFVALTVVTILKKVTGTFAPWLYSHEDPHLTDLQKKKAALEIELLTLEKKEKEKNLLASISMLIKEKGDALASLRMQQAQTLESKAFCAELEKEHAQLLRLHMQHIQNLLNN